MEPVLALNVAVVELAGTVTEIGTVWTLAIPPERAITVPPAGAAVLNVTVQVVLLLDPRLGALHCSAETTIGDDSETITDWEEPLSEAVMIAF